MSYDWSLIVPRILAVYTETLEGLEASFTNLPRRIETLLLVVGLIAGALVVTTSFVPSVPSGARVTGNTPIQHVFVIMKENHAFDNYFGTFPGADGIPQGRPFPMETAATSSTLDCVYVHRRLAAQPRSDARGMEQRLERRFAIVAERWGTGRGPQSMGYYDARQLPFYWDLARRFTLGDHYFQPMFGPTIPNRLFSFAAPMPGSNRT